VNQQLIDYNIPGKGEKEQEENFHIAVIFIAFFLHFRPPTHFEVQRPENCYDRDWNGSGFP
jgi:hypothetical protein